MLQSLQRQIKSAQGPGGTKISEISHNVFICPRADLRGLSDYDITHTLQLLPEELPLGGIRVTHLVADDATNVPRQYGEVIYKILLAATRGESKIAVMCQTSNGQAFVAVATYNLRRIYALYYMTNGDHTRNILHPDHTYLPQVVKYIQKSRSSINPSAEQLRHLMHYEQYLKEQYGQNFLQRYGARIANWQEVNGDPPTEEEYLCEIFSPTIAPTPTLLPSDDLAELPTVMLEVG